MRKILYLVHQAFDLYYLHRADTKTPIEDVTNTIKDLKLILKSKKIEISGDRYPAELAARVGK